MKKQTNNKSLWIALAAVFIFLIGALWGIDENPKSRTQENMVTADKPVVAFKFLEDPNQTVEIKVRGKMVRMSSEVFEGRYEKDGSTTTFLHNDGRKIDRYVQTGNELKHFTDYQIPPENCEEMCMEAEIYTFENAVLHKVDNGEVNIYYFEELGSQAPDADPALVDHASRSLRAELIKSLEESNGANYLLRIPVPFVVDKNGDRIPVEYVVNGKEYNQLQVRFKATEEQYPLTLDPTLSS